MIKVESRDFLFLYILFLSKSLFCVIYLKKKVNLPHVFEYQGVNITTKAALRLVQFICHYGTWCYIGNTWWDWKQVRVRNEDCSFVTAHSFKKNRTIEKYFNLFLKQQFPKLPHWKSGIQNRKCWWQATFRHSTENTNSYIVLEFLCSISRMYLQSCRYRITMCDHTDLEFFSSS